MSRGPGRVERAIAALFGGDSEAAFTVAELCEQVYGEAREPQHRVVVARAGKNLIGRGINLAWFRWSRGRGSQLVLYVPDNVMSYAKARIKSDPIPHRGNLEDALARHADYLNPAACGGGMSRSIKPSARAIRSASSCYRNKARQTWPGSRIGCEAIAHNSYLENRGQIALRRSTAAQKSGGFAGPGRLPRACLFLLSVSPF